MYKLVEQLAEKLARKYSLDKDALLNKNPKIGYVSLGAGLVEYDRDTHLSKCISKDTKTINVFESIQTLLDCIR